MKFQLILLISSLFLFQAKGNCEFEKGEKEALVKFFKDMEQKVTREDLMRMMLEHALESTLSKEQNIMLKSLGPSSNKQLFIVPNLIKKPEGGLFHEIEITIEYYHFSPMSDAELEAFKKNMKKASIMDTYRRMMIPLIDRVLSKMDYPQRYEKKDITYLKNYIAGLFSSSLLTIRQVSYHPLKQGVGMKKGFSLTSLQESFGEMTHFGKFE